jgi:hypothetical protein
MAEDKKKSHNWQSDRGFFFSRLNWDSPTPSPAGECAPPPLVPEEGAHTRLREREGGPNSDEGSNSHCGIL